ncbi:GGDEF domain-containing protein [uncultured Reyranella sp.]|uniref:GGDEF domain-containing protein n=1 Tax=uncultured Reyranella sp. TaxID=735512 RepID=UPI0025D68A7C|nr:GGDEF domain-containing protein [uncultured Reyranella sp.]
MSMSVDVLTLYLLNFVVAFVMAGIYFFSWSHHRDVPGVRGWAIALALGALGSLELSLRTSSSPLPLVIMANSLVVAAYATVWMSVRRFNTGERVLNYAVIPTVLFCVIFTIALVNGTDVNVRVALCSLAIAILSLLAGWEVLRARISEPLISRIPTALALFIMCVAMMVRIVFSLLEEPPQEPTTPFYDPTQGITLLINTICVVAMTLGFLMMTHERLRHHFESLAKTDELTALPNRRFLLDEGKRLRDPACVLMIDLDHFSEVNRTFGHAGGDRALVAFANLARRELRPSDLVARYGGEEFCALLRDVDEPEARRIAERLRARIAELSIDVDGHPLRITASIGLAKFDGDVESTIRKADAALYRAKALGRNQVQSAKDLSSTGA